MLLYLIKEQGSFYDPKLLFTSNTELKHNELIANMKKLFDVKFTDLGEFRIAIGDKSYSIYSEKVVDPMKIIGIQHC